MIPGLGRSPGEGNGNPLQYSCLENPTDGGACRATVHRVAKSQTLLSDYTHTQTQTQTQTHTHTHTDTHTHGESRYVSIIYSTKIFNENSFWLLLKLSEQCFKIK